MDLGLFARVIWRFRLLFLAGFVLAVALAFLSFVKVSFNGSPHLTYRAHESWSSAATVLITQQQFPEGRSVFAQQIAPAGSTKVQSVVPKFADPGRFTQLADLYAQLAISDDVRRLMLRSGPIKGEIQATPTDEVNGLSALPLLSIGGLATTAAGANSIAARAVKAFTSYLAQQQTDSGTPADQRVVLQVIKKADKPQLLRSRPKTLPVVVFLAVMLSVMGLAFALENLRPRIHSLAIEPVLQHEHALQQSRRQA